MGERRRMGWIALFFLLSGGPVLLAACFPPPGWRFLGGLASPDDVSVYLAAMYQGFRGMWLYYSPFDPSSVSPLVMYSPYLALGHLAALLQSDLTLIYHLTRLVCGWLTLAVAGRWTAVLFRREEARTSAWMLIAFSSGLGWLLAVIPSAAWQAQLVDLRLPEASTFLAAFTAPHFALGIALEGLALLVFWRSVVGRRWVVWAVLGGMALLGLGLTYPFALPVAYGTMGGYVIWAFWRGGRLQGGRALGAALVSGGIPLPFVLYYVQTFFFNSFWKQSHVAQNVVPTPGPGWLVAGYGLPLVLAVWGGGQVWRDRKGDGSWVLVSLWALFNGLALYLPLPFRWRLANGWHFALALLAARGLEGGALPWLGRKGTLWALRRWIPTPIATLRRVLLILTVPSTLMVSLIGGRIALLERGFPYYVPQDELRAMEGLAQYVNFNDVVLGAYPTGNVLPTRALCRVVVGQQFATLDPLGKLDDVTRFFDAGTSDRERQAILERYGVTVVYHGRWEQAMGGFDPAVAFYLRVIYQDGEVTVYRVEAEQ